MPDPEPYLERDAEPWLTDSRGSRNTRKRKKRVVGERGWKDVEKEKLGCKALKLETEFTKMAGAQQGWKGKERLMEGVARTRGQQLQHWY